MHTSQSTGAGLEILAAVDRVNTNQKHVLTRKVVARFGERLEGKRFALWGLAFKPNTDDMREAPSRVLVADLLSRGASITAYDPVAIDEARRVFGDDARIRYATRAMDALQDADALLIATEWKEFRSPDFERMRESLRARAVFDGRNLYDPNDVERAGLEYYPVGRLVPGRNRK